MTFVQRYRRPATQRAFTLVELLVVIGIIGVLMGILLPTISQARQQGRMTIELAATRQLMIAYLSYANDNKGSVVPGHTNENLKLTDDTGKVLSPTEAGKRWPWRLAAHIKFGIRGTLLVHEQVDVQANRSDPFWAYWVSLLPSFGLNYYALGGDLSGAGALNLPGCVSKLSQIHRSSRMIVFASARAPHGMPHADGYFKIIPPTKSSEYSATGWSTEPYRADADPAAWGYVHPRYNNRVIVACVDGHSEMLSVEELRDMTRWSDRAAREGNPRWRAH